MKFYRSFLVFVAFIIAFSSVQTVAFANSTCENRSHIENEITIEIHNTVSEEVRQKIFAHFYGQEVFSIESRGITCNLFGHNLETGTTSTITHKVSNTEPRCLKETYDYEICSRCDYSVYSFVGKEYIYCCS